MSEALHGGESFDAPAYKIPNKREIPEYFLAAVLAKIEKINRKAEKLGVEPFRYSLRHFEKPSEKPGEKGIFYPFVEVTVEGPKVEVPGGWILEGRVDFEEGLTIVNPRPGAELPVRYRNASQFCDHCNSDRRRNSIFVFALNGAYKQVGRNCLADYLGHNPERVLWAASQYGSIFDEDENYGGNWGEPMVGVLELLEAAAVAIRKHGFVSRKMIENGWEGQSTAGKALDYLFPPRPYGNEKIEPYEPEESDKAKALAVLDMVEGWKAKAEPSDYEFNCLELCGADRVRIKRAGLLVSLVAVWNKANEARIEYEKLVNAHVGAEGERRGFKAKFLGLSSFPSQFGVFYVARFASDEGMLVYKGGSPFWDDEIKAGDEIEFVGSIKEHGDYKGMKQTIVSRCKLGAMPVKVKKVKAAKKPYDGPGAGAADLVAWAQSVKATNGS